MADIADLSMKISLVGGDGVVAQLTKASAKVKELGATQLALKVDPATLSQVTPALDSAAIAADQLGKKIAGSASAWDVFKQAFKKKPEVDKTISVNKSLEINKNPTVTPENAPKIVRASEQAFSNRNDKVKTDLKELSGEMNKTPFQKMDKGLENVTGGFKKMESSISAAKIALIGLLYAAQQKMQGAGEGAVGLKNSAALTGVDTKTIQQYQYAARQVGLSNEDVLSSFEGLQEKMANIKFGKGVPEGWATFVAKMGSGSHIDVDAFMRDPDKLLQRLQEYAKEEKDVGLRNQTLTGLVGKNMASAIVQQAFRPDTLNAAPIMSDKEIKGIAQANAMWKEFSQAVDRTFANFSAKYGAEVIRGLTAITEIGLQFLGVMLKLADKYQIFEKLGRAIVPLAQVLDALVPYLSTIIDAVITLGGVWWDVMSGKLIKGSVSVQAELTKLSKAFGGIFEPAQKVFDLISKFTPFPNIFRMINSAVGFVSGAFKDLVEWMTKASKAGDFLKQIGDQISKAFSGTSDSIRDIISVLGTTVSQGIAAAKELIGNNVPSKVEIAPSADWKTSVGHGNEKLMPKPEELKQTLDWKAVLGLDAKALSTIGVLNIMGNVIAPNLKVIPLNSDMFNELRSNFVKPSLGNMTTSSVDNSTVNVTATVNTQATNAAGVADGLAGQLKQALNQQKSATQ